MSRLHCVLPLCCLLFATGTAQAILIQDFDANRHDRFADSSEFIGADYDFSGIGRLSTGGPWATMISPSYFLSANHLHPSPTSTVRFFESNNMTGAFLDRVVESGQRIDGSDLWLGKLTTPVTSAIATYPIVEPISLTGQPIHVVGRGGPTGMHVGRNVIDEVIPDFSHPDLGSSQGDIFTFDYDTTEGLGQDESRLQGGDSGGPTFAIVDGELALLGIHWFIYEIEDEEEPGVIIERGSGDTLVSSLIPDLQTAMTGEALTTVAIPEPSMVCAFALLTAGVAWRWR